VQASTLGSLEAMLEFLNENGVPIGSFGLGTLQNIGHRGTGLAATVLAFDVRISRQAQNSAVRHGIDIISGDVIYQVFDEFKRRKQRFLAKMVGAQQLPLILAIEPALIIRPYSPITIGVHVQLGTLTMGSKLMTIDNNVVGVVNTIREATSNIACTTGTAGQLYIVTIVNESASTRHLIYGRDFFEHDKLFSKISRRAFGQLLEYDTSELKLLRKYASFLDADRVRVEGDSYEDLLNSVLATRAARAAVLAARGDRDRR